MASFAEGLVKGLQQQQELNLRRSEQKRQQAISMSQLASAEEERQYRREQRDKQEKAVGEIRQLMDGVFGYDETLPAQAVPGQAPGQAAPAQTVRKQYDIYDSSPEGRERQLRYHSGYTRILMNNGLMSPADMKASAEYAGYLDKSGVSDAALNLFLTDGRDAKSLGFLAKKLNLDPNSVKITGSLVDNSAKIEAVGANGQAFSRPLGDIFSALGINAFENIQKAKREEKVTTATLENLGARTKVAKSQVGLNEARAEALGNQPIKTRDIPNLNSSVIDPSTGKAIVMPFGKEIVRNAADIAMDYGANGSQAVQYALGLASRYLTMKDWSGLVKAEAKRRNIRETDRVGYAGVEQDLLKGKIKEFLESEAGIQIMQNQFSSDSLKRRSAMDASADSPTE